MASLEGQRWIMVLTSKMLTCDYLMGEDGGDRGRSLVTLVTGGTWEAREVEAAVVYRVLACRRMVARA